MARRALLAVCILVALSACAGGSSGGTVEVELTDYDVILSTASVSAGTVEPAIDNRGGFGHEILVVRSDLAIDELPETSDGLFDEHGAGVTIVASARDIPAGGTATISKQLDSGGYFLVCNRPAEPGDTVSHFAHGMLAPLTVT